MIIYAQKHGVTRQNLGWETHQYEIKKLPKRNSN